MNADHIPREVLEDDEKDVISCNILHWCCENRNSSEIIDYLLQLEDLN